MMDGQQGSEPVMMILRLKILPMWSSWDDLYGTVLQALKLAMNRNILVSHLKKALYCGVQGLKA